MGYKLSLIEDPFVVIAFVFVILITGSLLSGCTEYKYECYNIWNPNVSANITIKEINDDAGRTRAMDYCQDAVGGIVLERVK